QAEEGPTLRESAGSFRREDAAALAGALGRGVRGWGMGRREHGRSRRVSGLPHLGQWGSRVVGCVVWNFFWQGTHFHVRGAILDSFRKLAAKPPDSLA